MSYEQDGQKCQSSNRLSVSAVQEGDMRKSVYLVGAED